MPFKPDNWPTLTPYMVVASPEASILFYRDAFGFRLDGEPMLGEDGKIMHVAMRFLDTAIMFAPMGEYGDPAQTPKVTGGKQGISLYIYCEDVDAHFARAKAAGATIVMEPADMFWGDRMYAATDPDGHSWSFATHLGVKA